MIQTWVSNNAIYSIFRHGRLNRESAADAPQPPDPFRQIAQHNFITQPYIISSALKSVFVS